MDWNVPGPVIVAPSTLRGLSRRSDWAGLSHLARHLGLLACTGALILATRGSVLVLPAMLAHGIVQVALFAGLHESVHRTAFRGRWLNGLVASAIGFVIFLPAGFFRRFHFAHHRFTQDPARDPELAAAKPVTLRRYLFVILGLGYWRDRGGELLRHAGGRVTAPFVPEAERPLAVREARLTLAGYALIVAAMIGFGWTAPVYLWLLPALLGQPFLRCYLLAEHTGCPECPDMLRNTRTTFANAAIRFLMWEMPYHTEHHRYPGVPFHRLADLHREIADKLHGTAPGYGATHRRYIAALRAGRGAAFTKPPIGA